VQIRNPAGSEPDEPEEAAEAAAPRPPRPPKVDPDAAGTVSYRCPAYVPAVKAAVAVVLLVAATVAGEKRVLAVGTVGALALAVWAVRDVLNRVRLRADATGVTVARGFGSRRQLAWAEIDAVRVDERPRLGVRTTLLEVDADAEIYLFSRYDLGVEPGEAAAEITALRRSPD
jgi:hypothetical protein